MREVLFYGRHWGNGAPGPRQTFLLIRGGSSLLIYRSIYSLIKKINAYGCLPTISVNNLKCLNFFFLCVFTRFCHVNKAFFFDFPPCITFRINVRGTAIDSSICLPVTVLNVKCEPRKRMLAWYAFNRREVRRRLDAYPIYQQVPFPVVHD